MKTGNVALQERLASKLNLTKVGHYFYGHCPFHNDHSPSFLLYPDYFICKSSSCGKKGTIEYLEKNISNIPLKPSTNKFKILPKWSAWAKRYGDIEEIALAGHNNVLKGNDVYFKRRGVSNFITQGKLGLLDKWAMFPVIDVTGQIIDIVVRGIRQENVKYVIRPYAATEMRPLYVPNWVRVSQSSYLYVVFGIVTAISLELIGEPVVTGITGKSLNPELLKDFQKSIIVIPDYNEEKDGAKLVNALGWRGKLKLADWPMDCSDLDDVRVKHGDNLLKELIGVNNGKIANLV